MLDALRQIIGDQYVLTEPDRMAPYLQDWRGRYQGRAIAVVKPESTQAVAEIVKLCHQFNTSIVPQGGNTSLSGASVPDDTGRQLILNLSRLDRIREIDVLNQTMTVDAGCILKTIQQAAEAVELLFPVSLAAEGSCTIGGNLSTNAGGTAVLRYGNMRDQCLGLEVVLPDGQVWHGLRTLRKDNTGYDLRDLFIGAEGTLGIITAAVLKLYPRPNAQVTALIGLHNIAASVTLLNFVKRHAGACLTGFELISQACLDLVKAQFPQLTDPFSVPHAQVVLLELSGYESERHLQQMLEQCLAQAYQQNMVQDVLIASSLAQAQHFWSLREHIPLAQARAGKNIKHDISLPVSSIPAFCALAEQTLHSAYPGCRILAFGHVGDGNLHYNVAPPVAVKDIDFLREEHAINQLVYQCVEAHHGSISAEHGIGQLKKAQLQRHKSPVELNLMHAIKHVFDPQGLMNPGKVL
jgi:FAD/FMN-containing dehydrogenase